MDAADWSASWIGVTEPERAPQGCRPAYWLRSVSDPGDVPGAGPALPARAYATALGLYELYVNEVRVADLELAPGYTQYLHRVPYQTYDLTGLLRPGRNVVAALLADGWYRGQVGMAWMADQFGTEPAFRLQVEVTGERGPETVARTDESWRTSTSHVTAAVSRRSTRADAGDLYAWYGAYRLVDLLTEQGGVDELRALVDAGDRYAPLSAG